MTILIGILLIVMGIYELYSSPRMFRQVQLATGTAESSPFIMGAVFTSIAVGLLLTIAGVAALGLLH